MSIIIVALPKMEDAKRIRKILMITDLNMWYPVRLPPQL